MVSFALHRQQWAEMTLVVASDWAAQGQPLQVASSHKPATTPNYFSCCLPRTC